MRASDLAQELDVLRSCSTAVRDWYIPVEQLAAERRQVTGHRTRHDIPAAFSDLDRLRRSGWCGAASRYNTEVARYHYRSANDIQRAVVVKSSNYHARAIRRVRHLLIRSNASV